MQNFSAYKTVPLLQATSVTTPVKDADGNPVLDEKGAAKTETTAVTEQTLPMGPASSQVAIKQLGTNGGGFFNVNSAHPYENPTPLIDFLELLAILVIAAALCYTFGQMVGDTRQGWAVLAAMTRHLRRHARRLRVGRVSRQSRATPPSAPTSAASDVQPGGNMEGKEVRFGVANSGPLGDRDHRRLERLGERDARFRSRRSAAWCPLFMIQLGEVIYGGVGSGLYGMLDLRHHRRLRRRPHGRAHARVPRQEDRGLRDEDGRRSSS